ncbi:MAG: PAS domain S-box protein [Pseudomonadota bacterium]
MAEDPLVAGAFDALPEPMLILDDMMKIRRSNAAWTAQQLSADRQPEVTAFDPRNMGAPAGHATVIRTGISETIATGTPFEHMFDCADSAAPKCVSMLASHAVISGHAYALVTLRDVTALHHARLVARETELQTALWAAVVQSTADAILTYDLDGRVTTWNPAAEALYEYTAEEMIGQSMERLYPADWPVSIKTYRDRILSGELVNFEATRVTKSGSAREVSITGAPVENRHGKIIAVSNIHRDVTELRKEEEARAIMALEAVHRSKNLMAVVIAIQRQIARSCDTIEEMSDKFSTRIASLSRSTDLLIRERYTKVPLAELIRAQCELFDKDAVSSVYLSGPGVVIEPQGAQTIGMVMFELLTNAIKYGALGTSGGHVDLQWDVSDDADGQNICLSWTEHGVTITEQPERAGFGSTVLKRLAGATLNGKATMTFGETGLRWSLTFPDAFFSPGGPAVGDHNPNG